MVKCLPSNCKALNPNPSTIIRKGKRKKKEKGEKGKRKGKEKGRRKEEEERRERNWQNV
jgi:hypothetical protein